MTGALRWAERSKPRGGALAHRGAGGQPGFGEDAGRGDSHLIGQAGGARRSSSNAATSGERQILAVQTTSTVFMMA